MPVALIIVMLSFSLTRAEQMGHGAVFSDPVCVMFNARETPIIVAGPATCTLM